MNPQIINAFKKLAYDLCIAFAAFFIALSAFFAIQPQSARTTGGGGVISPLSVAACNFENGKFNADSGCVVTVKSGADLEVQAGATEVHAGAESHSGTESHTGDATFGNVTADTITTTNLISQTVLLETDIVTATTVSADAVAAATVSVNGTPVFWATPIATPTSHAVINAAANGYLQCTSSTITDTLTATPIAGATPILSWASLGTITGDANIAASTYAGGIFTVTVKNSALTPAANSTGAAVKWCYIYTK